MSGTQLGGIVIRRFRESFSGSFISRALLLAGVTILANVFNYLYQVFAGRFLGPQEYAVFGSLFSVSYFVAIAATAIQSSIARFVSEFDAVGNAENRDRVLGGAVLSVGTLGLILLVVLVVVRRRLAAFLNVPDDLPVIAGVAATGALIGATMSGALQGLRQFARLGAIQLITFATKFGLGVVLLYMGMGVRGALWAVASGYLVGLGVSLICVSKLMPLKKTSRFASGRIISYSGPAAVLAFSFAVPTAIDVFLAKHYLPDIEAGYYTAASMLGKVLIFAPLGFTLALFPHVVAAKANKTYPKHVLKKAILLTSLIAGSGAITLWALPAFVLRTVFGDAYIPAVDVLRSYGLATSLFSLTLMFLYYSLAVDRFRLIYLIGLATLVEVAAWLRFHDSALHMAAVLLAFSALQFLLSIFFVLRSGKDTR